FVARLMHLHAVVGHDTVEIEDNQRNVLHRLCASRTTPRSFFNEPCSDSYTFFTPSPHASSVTRMYWTRRANPPGSTEAAWSVPHMARSSVRWRSTMHAPSATATVDGTSPTSWPE